MLIKKNNISSTRGFTLIELVIVSLLLGILSLVLFKSVQGIIQANEKTENIRVSDQTAHYIFSRMMTEIANGMALPLNNKGNSTSSSELSNNGSFEGINKKIGDKDSDSIRFISNNSAQQFTTAYSNHGPVEIQYSLEEDKNNKNDVFSETSKYSLIRRESPANIKEKEILEKRTIVFPLADNIDSLSFRFYKNETWLESWEGKNVNTPDAIEVTIKVVGKDNQIETYKTAFPFIQ